MGDSPSVTIEGVSKSQEITEIPMDTEEISDGEVFPSDVEEEDDEGKSFASFYLQGRRRR